MPKLVRLYITQVAIGFAIAAAFTALLLALNVGNLRHLVAADPAGPLAVFLIFMFNGIVFGGVQFAYAIMRMAEKQGPRGGGTRAPVTRATPQPVRAEAVDHGGNGRRARTRPFG